MKDSKVVLTASLLLLASLCFAQSGESRLMEGAAGFLRQKAIQKEIGVTKEQVSLFEGAYKNAVKALQAAIKANEATRNQAAVQAVDQREQKKLAQVCLKSLTPPQKSRLKQVWLQFLGPFATRLPEVSKGLGFSPAQDKKVGSIWKTFADKTKSLVDQRMKEMKTIPEPKDKNDDKAVKAFQAKIQEYMKAHAAADKRTMEAAQKNYEGQVVAQMTPMQRSKWSTMLGKKFDFKKAGIAGRA